MIVRDVQDNNIQSHFNRNMIHGTRVPDENLYILHFDTKCVWFCLRRKKPIMFTDIKTPCR